MKTTREPSLAGKEMNRRSCPCVRSPDKIARKSSKRNGVLMSLRFKVLSFAWSRLFRLSILCEFTEKMSENENICRRSCAEENIRYIRGENISSGRGAIPYRR